jgi:hypothetical protein
MKNIHRLLARSITFGLLLATLALSAWTDPLCLAEAPKLVVTAPPAEFFQIVDERDRAAARQFYKKFVSVDGLPVVAAAEVADEALVRTHDIVTHMLAGRADILKAMHDSGMYLIIIGKDQVYTDMPEYSHASNPDFMNERVRGTGGKPTSFGEENLLGLALDRYDDESIGVHEFCHTIDGTLRSIDLQWDDRLQETYRATRRAKLYEGAYAASNAGEYWAEVCQAYFDCNRANNYNHGPIGTREQLKAYDPVGYELVRSTFRLAPNQDWRYQFPNPIPQVIAPPAKFEIDPYYTKFSYARELVVVGRDASDEAIVRANEIVRRMFAYRQDILKAFIAENVHLVVLGRGESIGDLPEFKDAETWGKVDLLARYLEYSPEHKRLVVSQENLLANPASPYAGSSHLVRVIASAIHQLAGTRPVDPDWDDRPRDVWQQYELNLKRLDERFDRELQTLHRAALDAGKWQGTIAVHDHSSYWVAGVLAYFDAAGQEPTPTDSAHSISTRETLAAYDPALYDLVRATMAYDHRVDWRLPK